ncbi:DNA replication complex GINS family protein [Candidatus Micrarchaeota archaeon]|nr:DNA replication complex GINS family protein [Candidatus Micrarchaeota archaeon]
MKPLNYSILREIQKKETDSTRLSSLEEDFYDAASDFLRQKREEAFSNGSMPAIREYENIKKIISTIKERREEKIVLMAIRGEGTPGGLTPDEVELLKELSDSVKRFRGKMSELFSSEENGKAFAPRKKSRRVKLLKDVEPYKGLDNGVYGPFKSGEEVELPPEEAEWLLKAKMAETI